MTSSRPSVSIVIVSWNTRELLLDALATFLPLGDVRGEVVVVDNGSVDGSADAVEERHPDVRVIRNGRNLGFAGGVNVGLRAAREPCAAAATAAARSAAPGCTRLCGRGRR